MSDMTAPVDIANQALQAVGAQGRLAALDESAALSSREAALCLRWYGPCRDELLTEYDWPFARHRVALALLDETAPLGWTYVYAYPDQALAVLEVHSPSATAAVTQARGVPFVVGLAASGAARAIWTDADEAVAGYTRRVEDLNLWTPPARTALAARLALAIVGPLTGDTARRSQAAQEYVYRLRLAKEGARQERRDRPAPDADWIGVR